MQIKTIIIINDTVLNTIPNLSNPPPFPDSSVGKESVCNAGDPGLIPELERSPGEGKGYPLQYSGLKNSTDYMSTGSQRVGHK